MEMLFLLGIAMLPAVLAYAVVRKPADGFGCLVVPVGFMGLSVLRLIEMYCRSGKPSWCGVEPGGYCVGCGMEGGMCFFAFLFAGWIVFSMSAAIAIRCSQSKAMPLLIGADKEWKLVKR